MTEVYIIIYNEEEVDKRSFFLSCKHNRAKAIHKTRIWEVQNEMNFLHSTELKHGVHNHKI